MIEKSLMNLVKCRMDINYEYEELFRNLRVYSRIRKEILDSGIIEPDKLITLDYNIAISKRSMHKLLETGMKVSEVLNTPKLNGGIN